MMAAVTSGLTSVIDWIAVVVKSLIGTGSGETATPGALAALLPLFAIGISISAFLLGIKAIKSLVWGA